MKSTIQTIALVIVIHSMAVLASAKSVTVRIGAEGISSGVEGDRGPYFLVELALPEEVIGKRLDTVLLEFYVDVAGDEEIEIDYTPSIEVFPLSEAPQTLRMPRYTTSHPSSQPVAIGEGRRVTVDITDIVKGWIESPSTNHGLIIGSFSGPKPGDLDLRSDVIGSGNALQATFFYQNRFGQRVSEAR
jgi:hypothetical protein